MYKSGQNNTFLCTSRGKIYAFYVQVGAKHVQVGAKRKKKRL
jgi:hypothetical protein